MKKTSRSLAILCLSAVLLTQAAACGAEPSAPQPQQTQAPGTAAVTEAAETEAPEPTPLDALEARDMGGAEFVIISQDNSERQNFYHEENKGDTINDAILARDNEVSERLNLKITSIGFDSRADVTSAVQKTINAGDEAYHLIINSLSDGIHTLTSSGMLYDLTEMPYLQLDAEYWNKSMSENLRIFGKQFFSTGPIAPLFYQTPIVMMFNKRLAQDYDIGDMYQLVLDGKWTIDRLYEMTHTLSADLNSDGKMDSSDFWGLVTDGTFGNALYTGAGYNTVEQVGDTYQLTLGSDRSVTLIEKCAGYFGDRKTVINDKNGSESYGRDIFEAGNALFMDSTILGVLYRRGMKDDFGIIPCPKLDEAQETYYTACNTWLATGIAVPMLVSDPERTALIMETMAYISYKNIRPAVYEITLQGKVARDDASSIMLDYIFGNASFDFNTIFNFGDTSILLREAMLGEQENFVSKYEKKLKTAQKDIDKVLKFAKE